MSLVQAYTTSHEPSFFFPASYSQHSSSTRSSRLKQNKHFYCTDMDMDRTTTQRLQMQISAHFEANLHLHCRPSRLLLPLWGNGPFTHTFQKRQKAQQCNYRMINILLSGNVSGLSSNCILKSTHWQQTSASFLCYGTRVSFTSEVLQIVMLLFMLSLSPTPLTQVEPKNLLYCIS